MFRPTFNARRTFPCTTCSIGVPTTLPWIKPLATELGHEFLRVLFQGKALYNERLVIMEHGVTAPRKALTEFVLDRALLACTKSAIQCNLKWPTTINVSCGQLERS